MMNIDANTSSSPTQISLELLIYQISEVKSLMRELAVKFDKFQEDIEKRIIALELWQAGQSQRSLGGMDAQKVALGALSVAASAIAVALGLIQAGIFK